MNYRKKKLNLAHHCYCSMKVGWSNTVADVVNETKNSIKYPKFKLLFYKFLLTIKLAHPSL